MKRLFVLLRLMVLFNILLLGCRGSETRNAVPEKTEVTSPDSVSDTSGKAAGEEKPIWPSDLEKSLSDLQELWKRKPSLSSFFLEGEKVKGELAAQLPVLLAEMKNDSPLTVLREKMQPYPCWHVQAGPQGEKTVIFWDYGYLLRQARDTADRAFFQLCVDWFPADSMEYFQPSWQLPLEDTLVFSMLGGGMHRHSLARIRQQLAMGSPYAPALGRMQRALIRDILHGKNYWYDAEAIVTEIDSILQHEARFFPKTAYDSLPQRQEAFQQADSLGLRVNWRAGG